MNDQTHGIRDQVVKLWKEEPVQGVHTECFKKAVIYFFKKNDVHKAQ